MFELLLSFSFKTILEFLIVKFLVCYALKYLVKFQKNEIGNLLLIDFLNFENILQCFTNEQEL